jgi:hypothetical protein
MFAQTEEVEDLEDDAVLERISVPDTYNRTSSYPVFMRVRIAGGL